MNQTEFRIKAKKISELNDFMPSHTIPYDGADAFLPLAYTQNNAKQNYKVSLKDLAVAISNDYGVNDDNLRDRILDMIQSGDIQLPAGPQGPQGPAGGDDGSGCDCNCKEELVEINRKLDEILRILTGTNKEYPVSYSLQYITADKNNPTSIKYNESAAFKFERVAGYEFPNTVEVNTSYTYNKASKTITINPITDPDLDVVTIKITGVLGFYTLTFSTTNLIATVDSESSKPSYNINDEINITFKVQDGFEMPLENQISLTGATILKYNRSEGKLKIRCTGASDMVVTAAGQMIAQTYYFAHVAFGVDDAGILEYDQNYEPTGVIHITDRFFSAQGKCPIDYNKRYSILSNGETSYGREDVYVILPKKYLNTSNYKFTDDDGNLYDLWAGTFLAVTVSARSVYEGNVDGEPYVIVRIAPEGIFHSEIYFKKI